MTNLLFAVVIPLLSALWVCAVIRSWSDMRYEIKGFQIACVPGIFIFNLVVLMSAFRG